MVELLGYASAAWQQRLLPTRCALAVGEPIPLLDSSTSCGSYGESAVFANFGFASVAWCCDPSFIAYLHGLPIVWYLYWFFRHVWCLVLCFSVAFAVITRTIPAQVLIVALRLGEVFSPILRFSR